MEPPVVQSLVCFISLTIVTSSRISPTHLSWPHRLFSFFYIYFIDWLIDWFFGGMHWVLVAVHGIFVEACRIFPCGVRVFSLSLRRASSVIVACGLNCPVAYGILVPCPGIEPASPALEGGFFTTGPPGKSLYIYYWAHYTSRSLDSKPWRPPFFTLPCGLSHQILSIF